MDLQQLARVTGGQLLGQNITVECFCIDSRALQQGEVFIAIAGERFDGHAFCGEALEKGASALIVEKASTATTKPQLVVPDTIRALAQIAQLHRSQFNRLKTFAITGSCGKTTVKQMLAAILLQQKNVLASKGNFNNHIGLPLSLLRLSKEHEAAVFELGANHMGEIRQNVALVQPDVAVITAIAPAHVEGFGSLANIVKAKGEIFEGLVDHGLAIAEADSPYLSQWQALRDDLQWMTFGLSEQAMVQATSLQINEIGCYQFELCYEGQRITIQLPVMGEHNVHNAAAAAAMALAGGLTLADIKAGLETMENEKGRLVVQRLESGAVVIDDTYNANPTSMKAAIDTLMELPKKHILVMGDMAELGEEAERYHAEIGEYAKQVGVDLLYVVGQYSETVADAFGERQAANETKSELVKKLKQQLGQGVVCLVKGSRSAKMEDIVAELIQK